MWISRVRVNGGFLAGLDVALSPGLNVVIGPRGTGKTALLELIRHGLGIAHADPAQARKQQAAINQLLGSGEVIVDLDFGPTSRHLVVDASGAGRSLDTATSALALGQNELEGIASNATSRLNLIDLRASVDVRPPNLDRAAEMTASLATLRATAEQLTEGLERRTVLAADRAVLADRERELMAGLGSGGAEKREQLRAIESQVIQLTDQYESAEQARRMVINALSQADALATSLAEIGSLDVGFVVPSATESVIPTVRSNVDAAATSLRKLETDFRVAQEGYTARQNVLRIEAEPLRNELETAESGLGQVTAQIRNLDAEIAELARAETQLSEIQASQTALASSRDALLDEFETWQESLFEARQAIAVQVSNDLNNRVIVEVQHLADAAEFRDILVDGLQGSGLQFRPVADALSRTLLPRQLLGMVERNDVAALAAASGLTPDRAARALGGLTNGGALAGLAHAYLHDRVEFKLMVGATTRSVEDLSTGQKCAATLPIVLTERSKVLVIDQPEDHLDNAYLVKNVVHALENRGHNGGQTIVATHNANIPVLGSADVVISLGSDGVRGYAECVGRFDSPEVVEVITELMEGGKEAFRQRAAFYDEFGSSSD